MTTAEAYRRPETTPRARRAAARPAPGTPLFVVGTPFSGATALAWALGQHPSLRPVVGASGAGRLEAALRLVEEELLPLLGRDELAALLGGGGRGVEQAPVVCAPEIAGRLGVAKVLFPELRLVHLHRDAAAVVPKLVAAARRDGHELSEARAERIWRRMVDDCLAAEHIAGADRTVRLAWEQLVTDPVGALRRCLEPAGMEAHPGCLWPLRLLTTADVDSPGRPPRLRASRSRPAEEPGGRLLHRRLRQMVESVVPPGATVLVASRGDDELLRFRERDGMHFPQLDDGTWAGFYPGTDADAVAHVDDLVGRGATHFLFSREGLWWLDHYGELRSHLERSACLLAFDAEVGAIWQLDPRRRLVLPPVLTASRRTPQEPDNAHAFESAGADPPARRRENLGGSLWAVTTFFNPAGYASKKENYERFRDGLARAGIPLLAVELAFGDAPFELGNEDADQLVQLRGGDVLWQKERLLNLGVQQLPGDCDKVAWLDADVLIARPDWAEETSRLLERHLVVQPFSHCVRLPEGAATCEPATLPVGSGEGELFYGIAWGVHAKGRRSLRRYGDHGHTGFAWAARRRLLERHTLYDANLLGNGDTDIAHAMFGSTRYWGLQKLGEQARAHLRRWAEPFASDVGRSVAYVDGVLTHLWHGSQQHRLYDRPLDVLHAFDPERDLVVGRDGLYRWADAASELRAWSRSYFADRREDG
jgi:hypothetical protein